MDPGPSTDRLTRAERRQLVLLYGGILATTVLAFLLALQVSARYDLPTAAGTYAPTFGLLALLMYIFGLRHGVDADHLAAIDNTTRKLLNEGRRPLTVGTWFSLGHSTIVVGLIVALIGATRAVAGQLPELRQIGSVLGTSISGTFLFLIGCINVVIVWDIYRVFRRLRAGEYREGELEAELTQRGFLARYFGRLFRLIREPWQIYPIGVLFGLGFDTASEVALIAIAVGVGFALPLYAVLVLPLLFTCGMVLVDTSNSVAMRAVYGWAFLKPIRKIYYNLTITVISVLVAFAVGGVELLQVLAAELHLSGGAWDWFRRLDFQTMGFGILALFVGAWVVAYAVYRIRGYEETPSPPAAMRPDPPGA